MIANDINQLSIVNVNNRYCYLFLSVTNYLQYSHRNYYWWLIFHQRSHGSSVPPPRTYSPAVSHGSSTAAHSKQMCFTQSQILLHLPATIHTILFTYIWYSMIVCLQLFIIFIRMLLLGIHWSCTAQHPDVYKRDLKTSLCCGEVHPGTKEELTTTTWSRASFAVAWLKYYRWQWQAASTCSGIKKARYNVVVLHRAMCFRDIPAHRPYIHLK